MSAVYLSQFLDTVGDGSGSTNGAQNFTGNPTNFQILAGRNEILRIRRLTVVLAATTINFAGYGAGGPISPGIRVSIFRNNRELVRLTQGMNIRFNLQWTFFAGISPRVYPAAGLETLSVAWKFTDDILINSRASDSFRVRLAGDYSTMSMHVFQVQGERTEIQPAPGAFP